MRHYVGIFVAAVLVSGCGGGGGGGPAGTSRTVSCDFPGDYCDSLAATMTDAQQATLQSNCTGAGGTFAASACSTAGKLAGTCRYSGAALVNIGFNFPGGVMTEYYDATAWTAGSAQTFCQSDPPGLWVP